MNSIIVLVLLGIGLGVVIGIVVKLFTREPDPRQEQIESLLPSANCGACGFAGCADFARALEEFSGELHVTDDNRVLFTTAGRPFEALAWISEEYDLITITSRTAEKHRRVAFEIGVNEYLGKPYRDEELLELIRRYLGLRTPA